MKRFLPLILATTVLAAALLAGCSNSGTDGAPAPSTNGGQPGAPVGGPQGYRGGGMGGAPGRPGMAGGGAQADPAAVNAGLNSSHVPAGYKDKMRTMQGGGR